MFGVFQVHEDFETPVVVENDERRVAKNAIHIASGDALSQRVKERNVPGQRKFGLMLNIDILVFRNVKLTKSFCLENCLNDS